MDELVKKIKTLVKELHPINTINASMVQSGPRYVADKPEVYESARYTLYVHFLDERVNHMIEIYKKNDPDPTVFIVEGPVDDLIEYWK